MGIRAEHFESNKPTITLLSSWKTKHYLSKIPHIMTPQKSENA